MRGRASTADARFVERLAHTLGVDFEGGRADVGRQAEMEGISMETAGRRERHAFFAECSRRWRCPRVLLAHHADDQAETVLWNLLRGSRGMAGMTATQRISINGRALELIRPWLSVRRSELRRWLEEEGLKWREDATNAEPVAARNRLRNEVLPLLSEIARRDVADSLVRSAVSAAELREIESWAVAEANALDPQGRLHVGRLRELPEPLRRACVFDYLRSCEVPDLDRSAVDRVLGLMEPGAAARVVLKGERTVRRKAGRLWVE
ncbi:hypothetical protein HAHE_11180 [Haloferula helveola]|uniref:tRNA(Ile)-lysidine synthetase n=1 Tax=Haloferula helveola TaxID=490095 RepID=A0ABN6H6W0_9BACT|nr:hypothetical protein HAHE_11180 [Haloferula helveola]